MSTDEITISTALYNKVTCLPGSWDKRFIRTVYSVRANEPLTEKQIEWLYRLLYRYRKQVPKVYEKYKDHPQCCAKPKPEPKSDKEDQGPELKNIMPEPSKFKIDTFPANQLNLNF